MPRKKEEWRHEAHRGEILRIARAQLAQGGAAALSLRAIAAEMNLSAPALYRYFPSRDDIITALILEAFYAVAEAIDSARKAQSPDDFNAQMMAITAAYRAWALAHPTDFSLIYGNPIPGYVAPAEQTIPAARQAFVVVIDVLSKAAEQGKALQYAGELPPASISEYLQFLAERDQLSVPLSALYAAVSVWSRMHGIIMLELFHHLQPVIGDVEAFYHVEMRATLRQYGLDV
jgi:AcrR family transcriptional regulator